MCCKIISFLEYEFRGKRISLLCNVSEHAQFSNERFNSVLGGFYMFRTSCVHLQEDHLYMQFCMVSYITSFSFLYEKKYHTKLHVQMVFLLINTWCSKLIQDAKNWIKTLIWKVSICWFTLHNCTTMHGAKLNWFFAFCGKFRRQRYIWFSNETNTFLSTAFLAAILWCCPSGHSFTVSMGGGQTGELTNFICNKQHLLSWTVQWLEQVPSFDGVNLIFTHWYMPPFIRCLFVCVEWWSHFGSACPIIIVL